MLLYGIRVALSDFKQSDLRTPPGDGSMGEMSGRPNILWIVTTQWRAQACGYAGDPNVSTPVLDALAAEAVNYTQAVTPHPFGPFARAALLTGVPSPQNGVRDYYDALPEKSRTIAHALREKGYVTGFWGKWHLARRDPTAPLVGEAHARTIVPEALRGGFEFWEGFESGFLLNDPWLHGTRWPEPRRFEGYQSDLLCARAAAWLAEVPATKPCFGVVSLEAPHPPYDAPAAGIKALDPRAIELPANVPRGGEIEEKSRRELSGYYAHVTATDRALGGLIALARRQQAIVVFTSVHGDMHGAHGLFRKGWPYEESVRVPLLVCRPGESPRRDDSAISLLDLPGLAMSWAEDRPNPGGLKRAKISMPSVVARAHQCDRIWRGVRTPARKLVLNHDGSPWLFFDLERDPHETRNLVADSSRAGELAELNAALRKD